MLEVDIDKILPVTEARDSFNKIVDEVEGTDHMYVLTKNGKPAAVVVGVNHLEKLTGKTPEQLTSVVEKKADETPVVEEVNEEAPQTTEVPITPQVQPETINPTVDATTPPVSPSATTDGSQLNTPTDNPVSNGGQENKDDDLFV